METLIEAGPFMFGVLLGMTCIKLGGLRKHPWLWGVTCVALGSFATFVSGEWHQSPLYFLFDIGLVAIVSIGTVTALTYFRRYRAG